MISDIQQNDMILAGFGGLGPWELGIILILVLVVFGAGKLPGTGSALGEAIKNFKKSIRGGADESEKETPSSEKKESKSDITKH